MSFIIEINGNEITSIEELKANFDIDVLLNHRSNFDDWLFGWDYEDEAAQVRELSPDLSDDDWLKNVCKIIGIPSAKLTAAKRKRTSEAKKAAEAAEAAEAAAKAAAEEEEKKKKAHFANQDFLMPIEDVFFIEGRGTVVTGRIERGIIKVNDEVEIVGIHDTVKTTVIGVETFRKILDQGEVGDNVGCLLRGIKKEDVKRGQVLARPGSILPHTKFIADFHVFSKEEGGRCTPFYNNYRPQFYFRTTDVTGTVTLPEDTDLVMPGDNVTLTIELFAPIAMETGLRVCIREGGHSIAYGTVVAIIK